ncbi:MAG: hypothetical protein N0E48_24975 [Candidatus Thiodiazotropha endolucinida]|nr:hypothetical protein [Candidatus Thiodiazotropha taylori]MCW4346579.1 hypothetical protein [Candidatus Thiodiazotropha endolucinida]
MEIKTKTNIKVKGLEIKTKINIKVKGSVIRILVLATDKQRVILIKPNRLIMSVTIVLTGVLCASVVDSMAIINGNAA